MEYLELTVEDILRSWGITDPIIATFKEFFSSVDEIKLISKGENAVESNHVKNFLFDSEVMVIRGDVQASMRDRTYKVEIQLDNDQISSASCSCPRGTYACHHMAALCIFAHYNISVTDKSCSWNVRASSSTKTTQTVSDIFPLKSNFGVILSACKREKYPPSLFKRIAGVVNLDGVKQIQRGREHEKVAIETFELVSGKTVQPTGLWLHSCGYLGASPDGVVNDDALVEVKCPWRFRGISILEAIKQDHGYIVKYEEDKVIVKKNHHYYHQIQGQLALTNKKTCYLVIWTPNENLVVEVEKEENWENNIVILKNFYLKHYVKYITGEKYS